MVTQSNKSDSLLLEMQDQGKKLNDIELSMTVLSSKYDELLSRTDKQDKELDRMGKKIAELEQSLSRKDEDIVYLETAVLNMEQYSSRKNVEIHGLERADNEDLIQEVNKLAVKVGLLRLATRDVEAIHRLPTKEGKIPPVLIRFTEGGRRDQ